MAGNQFTKKINVPENLKGLVIGKYRAGLNDISQATKAHLFLNERDNEIYAKGTDQQIKLAEQLIQEKLVRTLRQRYQKTIW